MQALNGLRVLIIDDDIDNRELLSFSLEHKGAKIIAADSAQKGLQMWEQHEIHVILCDMTMPDKDGFWFIGQLRAREAQLGKHTPTIALTGVKGETMQQESLAAGFQIYLLKPVEPNELISAISRLSKS